jgi:ankyrin repeat protein
VLFNRVMNQFEAAKKGDLQQLRATLYNVNDVKNFFHHTVLHYAARGGSVDCVNYCLEMGANVNACNNLGSTPLHLASLNGNVNVVRALLDAGANVDATGNDGRTPLNCALRFKRVEVTRLLIDRGGNVSKAIPDWVTTLIESRSKCRFVSIAIIGIHKYHRTTMTGYNDINVIKLISKHIWSMRLGDGWATPPIDLSK